MLVQNRDGRPALVDTDENSISVKDLKCWLSERQESSISVLLHALCMLDPVRNYDVILSCCEQSFLEHV